MPVRIRGALKAVIAGRRSKHDASRNSAGVLRPGLKAPERPEEVPGPMHPLVRIPPDTGRPTLYLGRRRIYPSQFIEGFSKAESEELLDRLWEHATKPELSWMHVWRPGDFAGVEVKARETCGDQNQKFAHFGFPCRPKMYFT